MIIRMGEEKGINNFLNHTTSDPMIKFYQKNAGDVCVRALPICPKCEKIGLRDKGGTMTCPNCGYHGPFTLQLSTYLKQGLYK